MFFSSASQSVLRIRSDFPISGQILLSCRTLCRVSSSEPLANLVAGRAGAGQTSPSASILHIRMWKVENPVWKPGSVSTGCGKVPWLPNTRQWTKKCWFSKRFPSFPHSTSYYYVSYRYSLRFFRESLRGSSGKASIERRARRKSLFIPGGGNVPVFRYTI